MSNEVPHWVDDGALNWAPERPFAPPAARRGPWSPPASEPRAEIRFGLAPWRLGIGLCQGLFFYLLFASRNAGLWPGADPFLFDAGALAGLFAPLILLDGIGFVPARRLAPYAVLAALLLASLGWYHRWRILGMERGHAGIALLVLCAAALFIAQAFLRARAGTGTERHRALFEAAWTLAARLLVFALALGAGAVLLDSPLLPRVRLEQGDVLAMPLLGFIGALAFQVTAAWPRITAALKDALVAAATIALPLACAAGLLLISMALAQGAAPLALLLPAMLALILAINASHRGGPSEAGPRKAWRDGAECFGAALLPILAGLAAWSLAPRIESFGWTPMRIFAAAGVGFCAAYGLGYSAAAVMSLAGRGRMRGLDAVNIVLGLLLLLGCIALASPLADPMRLGAAAQAARLQDGRIAVEAFDFAQLAHDDGRYGLAALEEMTRGPYADIARAAQLARAAAGLFDAPRAAPPNPTEIGANIAVRTLGASLPAALLARDWSQVAGIPACLTEASQACDAYFMDMNGDGRDEILLVSGSESRWWGAVMTADTAGRWAMAGRIAAPACGPSLSDLRAGRFSLAPPLPGFKDMDIGGMRLSVIPTGPGCTRY